MGSTEVRADLGRRLAMAQIEKLCQEQRIGPAARPECACEDLSFSPQEDWPRGGVDRRHLQAGAGHTFTAGTHGEQLATCG
ncbi:hypothetical protein ABZY06_35120 [Streptomyces sp. NPDC006540]|uniref:hypothetical protein n=1 Tax=Streptomyces sp. NPDC006540 TaxID=3155353 RepID=UPI0033B94251